MSSNNRARVLMANATYTPEGTILNLTTDAGIPVSFVLDTIAFSILLITLAAAAKLAMETMRENPAAAMQFFPPNLPTTGDSL